PVFFQGYVPCLHSSYLYLLSLNDSPFNDIHPLSLHDALPIYFTGPGTDLIVGLADDHEWHGGSTKAKNGVVCNPNIPTEEVFTTDRKSTRLNSSHVKISYAVFCLKKKNQGVEGFFQSRSLLI